MKIIMGPAEDRLKKQILLSFEDVIRVKPQASRSESKEIYLLCQNFGNSQDPLARQLKDLGRKINALEEGEQSAQA